MSPPVACVLPPKRDVRDGLCPLAPGRRNKEAPLLVGASLVAQLVKNLPAMRETWVGSLGWEGALGKGKATHSSILAWRIPWTSPWGCKGSDTTE